MNDKTSILFLCTGNSCRSQMAEGWARRLKSDTLNVRSAGIVAKGVDPRAVRVMEEVGVDISSQRSKTVAEILDTHFEYVITLCGHARETCPVFPGRTTMVHHGFADPPKLAEGAATGEEALDHYRRIRDEIRAYVETLPDSLRDERHDGLFISPGLP